MCAGEGASGWGAFSQSSNGSTRVINALIAVLALVALAASVQRIVPTIDFSAMKLEITWVRTNAQIEEAREEYGAEIEQEGHLRVPQKAEGFAVLVRRDGDLVCRLWALKPENVDDQRTTALGHELLHCVLGDYHRD
jgi:hypothetical protein